MSEEQRYNFVYCLHCRYDVEKEEGYLAGKHWNFCPRCGSRLVRRRHPGIAPWAIDENGLWSREEGNKNENQSQEKI